MALIHKDQGTISRGEVADLLQGCNVTIHGKGSIGGHQAQPMLLQGSMSRFRWYHRTDKTTAFLGCWGLGEVDTEVLLPSGWNIIFLA
jgi:hypothetical protein